MTAARENQAVLSYHNSLLRHADVSLLDGPHWLNDTLVGFFFEYLENDVCKHVADKVAFLCPEVVQLLKSVDGTDASTFLDSMYINSKDLIFMPVNDSQSLETPGGTHWSLLMFRRPNGFHHYDSSNQTNVNSAMDVVRSMSPHLCPTLQINFVNQTCPQQNNGYDCGVHVILNAEVLARHFLFDVPLDWYKSSELVKARKRLKALICALSRGDNTHKF